MPKLHKNFEKLLKSNGLVIEQGKGHYSVTKNGTRVGTVSSSGEANALRQAVRDLARQGLLKDEKQARMTKFS